MCVGVGEGGGNATCYVYVIIYLSIYIYLCGHIKSATCAVFVIQHSYMYGAMQCEVEKVTEGIILKYCMLDHAYCWALLGWI